MEVSAVRMSSERPSVPVVAASEGPGLVAMEWLAWIGVVLWGGGLVWFMMSDLVAMWFRHRGTATHERDGRHHLRDLS